MPDKWEYPWYAAWDLAFHTVSLALVDFDFAKQQLLLMLRNLYAHPNGQIPAYEWNFSDVNPPVHAWATLYLYKIEKNLGREDVAFPGALVPGPDAQLQLVGEPQGPAGKKCLRRRVPRARQHRRLRPQRAASYRRLARAGGRDRMDGFLRAEHARDGGHPRRRESGVRRDRVQVPRERHLDFVCDGQGWRAPRRHVGRAGRFLLRRAAAAARRSVPPESALDGRVPAALREHDARGRSRGTQPEADGADRALQETPSRGDRPRGADRRRLHRLCRTPAPLTAHPQEARAHSRLHARREGVPRPARPSLAFTATISTTRSSSIPEARSIAFSICRPNPTTECSEATRTGADRSGCRSTCW